MSGYEESYVDMTNIRGGKKRGRGEGRVRIGLGLMRE